MQSEFDAKVVHKFEHETWSRCAGGYLEGFAGMTRETIPFLIEGAKIKRGDRVLDIGSGPGHVAAYLAETGCVVSGIDFSKAMVETANAAYSEIEFIEADAEKTPFDNDEFDTVISNFVVHHLSRPDLVFREVSRILKPSGRFAFTVFADPEAQSSIGAFFAAVTEHFDLDEMPHGPLFGVTDLDLFDNLLAKGGLEDATYDFKDFNWKTESADPIIQSFRDWGNISALPPELQDKIELSTRQNLEEFRTEDGFVLPHKALMVSASVESS